MRKISDRRFLPRKLNTDRRFDIRIGYLYTLWTLKYWKYFRSSRLKLGALKCSNVRSIIWLKSCALICKILIDDWIWWALKINGINSNWAYSLIFELIKWINQQNNVITKHKLQEMVLSCILKCEQHKKFEKTIPYSLPLPIHKKY